MEVFDNFHDGFVCGAAVIGLFSMAMCYFFASLKGSVNSRLSAVIERAQHHIDDADGCCGTKPKDRTNEEEAHAVGVKSTALNLLRIAKGEE